MQVGQLAERPSLYNHWSVEGVFLSNLGVAYFEKLHVEFLEKLLTLRFEALS